MLVHRLRRWPNIKPTMAQCLVFACILHIYRALDFNPLTANDDYSGF